MELVRGSAGILTIGVLSMIVLAGCASTAKEHRGRDSNLSDAAEQAKKPPEQQKKLPVRHDEDDEEERNSLSFPPTVQPRDRSGRERLSSSPDGASELSRYQVGAASGFGFFGGGPLRSCLSSGVQAGGYLDDDLRFDLGCYVQSFEFRSRPDLEGLRNPAGITLDLSGRGYLTPKHTFMGVYGVAGIRWGYMWWKFMNPIRVVEDRRTRTLRGDGIQTFGAYTGLGLSLMQVRHVHLGGNVIGGFQGYNSESSEGFDNDLLAPQSYVQLRVEMSYVWE